MPQSPVIIPAGATTATISITLVDNTIFENLETLELTLGTPIGAILGTITSHTLTILDDDAVPTVSFVAANATVLEGSGNGSILVSLSSSTVETVVVPFTVTGTASVQWDSCTYSSGDQPGDRTWGITDAGSGSGAGCVPWNNHLSNLTGVSNGSGVALFPSTIPSDPSFRGLDLHVQAGVVDASIPRGFALTNALHLRVGDGE